MIIEHPPCESCGKLMFRKTGEDGWHFRRRKCCGHQCSKKLMTTLAQKNRAKSLARLVIAEKRACAAVGCDQPMKKRDTESVYNFERRKTCGAPGCSRVYWEGLMRRVNRSRPAAARLDDNPINYGKGFGPDADPGDGGPIRLSKPDYQTYGGVGRW